VLTQGGAHRWGRVRCPGGDLELDHREDFLGHGVVELRGWG
jgi:hypothetical protein